MACFSWTNPTTWDLPSCPATVTNDTVAQAAIRAQGINPVPNADGTYSYLAPYDPNGPGANTDATAAATQAAAAATAYYSQQLAANTAAVNNANQQCGGFIADLLNPFSPNIDPTQWNCQVAQVLNGINWTAVIALAIVLAILATVHQVKEIV